MGSGSSSTSSCYGIGCCSNSYHLSPQYEEPDASWCANEGGYCTANGAKATIYYGWGLTWQKKTISDGTTIRCNNNNMGCDPLPGTSKYCFKVQEPVCCECDYSAYYIGQYNFSYGWVGRSEITDSNVAKSYITNNVIPITQDALEDTVGVDLSHLDWTGAGEEIYDRCCAACSGSMVPAVDLPNDHMVWTPDNNPTMPSLYELDLYLVPIITLLLLFLSCVQCVSLVRRCTRGTVKGYGVVKKVDYDTETGTDEAVVAMDN